MLILFSLLAAFATVIYIIFGGYIFIKRPYSAMHRNFFFMCISFSLYAFGFFAITFNNTGSNIDFFYKLLYTGTITYCVFLFQFTVYLTDSFTKKYLKYILFTAAHIVPAVFLYQNWIHNLIRQEYPNGWYQAMFITAHFYNSISILITFIWILRTKSKKVKRQGTIYILWAIVTIPIVLYGDYYAKTHNLPCPAGVLVLIWISSIFYLTVKYQMFEINPQHVLSEIVNNLGSVIMLYNKYGYMTWSNINDSTNNNLKAVLNPFSKLDNLIGDKRSLIPYNEKDAAEKLVIKRPFAMDDNIINCTVSIKHVTDSYGDFMGTMSIVSETENEMYSLIEDKLSKREYQVIQLLIGGLTYKKISKELKISENTLKTHVTSCYNKLGVNNKIEVMNMLSN